MSRKHFIAIASAIANLKDPAERAAMARVLMPVFRDANPAFDIARFCAAANVDREAVRS